jgi:TIR domain
MKIFLSHASEDEVVAESIAFSLRGRGHKVFLDRDNLPLAASYDHQIESAVNDSETFVFLISPDSLADGRYTLTELKFARRQWPDPNGRVLPVMVRSTPLEAVPPYLKAVSILEPVGNIAAETSSAVHNMRSPKRRSDEVSIQYRNALGLWIVAVSTFMFIAVIVERPIVNGWDILGLAVPFYLAIVTYSAFNGLDGIASDQATEVISSWLQGRSQRKPDLGKLIVNAFDRIYTLPLLSLRAFRRSTVISMIAWLLVFFIPWIIYQSRYYNYSLLGTARSFWGNKSFLPDIALNLTVLVVADYMSLFFVRRFLNSAQQHPILASFASSLVGFMVVIIGYFVLTMISTFATLVFIIS